MYTSFVDIPSSALSVHQQEVKNDTKNTHSLPTSSYDALMRLSTLDECIQDALSTRKKLAQEIERLLNHNSGQLALIHSLPEAEQFSHTAESTVANLKKKLDSLKRRRTELSKQLRLRRNQMVEGKALQKKIEAYIAEAKTKSSREKEIARKTLEDITGQRRRICEDLLHIFPIEPIEHRTLDFSIRGLKLPNSDFNNSQDEEVAAALGFVAQAVHQLSLYLSVPLPYPIRPRSSTSTIDDPISMTSGPRTYPLFTKGAVRYRFEYAVFLLNKDIEILANWLGLRLLDIRQTLPNLKYLLFVATAGKGELPARKAGGIKGLLHQGNVAIGTKASNGGMEPNMKHSSAPLADRAAVSKGRVQ
jgi:UV radiation resistance-associated gene protein